MIYFWVKYRHKAGSPGYRLIEGSMNDFLYFTNQAYSWILNNSFFTTEALAKTYATDSGWTVLFSKTGFDAYDLS